MDLVSGRKLASEDATYIQHKKYEALMGKTVYKNPRNAPSDACPRDEAAITKSIKCQ
ncbi:hypothetical protein SK128_025922 [Halocaridina rubra]|uniref:Uncharacterized protein n=1 Tax=Halocaridina rubra TaxID=373956 RepID=A0AAN8WXN4_HALRR